MGDICWGKIPGRSCRRLRYWSMLSVGTDGCRHLSSLRWDSGPYFEADKDCGTESDVGFVILGSLASFLKPEHFGNQKKSEQRWNEDVRKDTHNTCNWATSFTVPDVVSNRWITRTWRLVTGLHFWRWIIKEYQGQETQRWEMSYCLLVCFEMEEQQTLSRILALMSESNVTAPCTRCCFCIFCCKHQVR